MKGNFDKYVNLIRKRAWECSKRYNIEYSECESQGFLIYCECLEKYDVEKSMFCTYLYVQLNKLNDFCMSYKRQKGNLIQDYFKINLDDEIDYSENISRNYDNVDLEYSEFLLDAKNELSEKAFDVLVWIISREWECVGKTKPTLKMASEYFMMSLDKMRKFWNELKVFWNGRNFSYRF